MTPLGWFVIIMSIFAGVGIGYFINNRFPNLASSDKKNKKIIDEVINNPHLLAKKLKEHSKIYDGGKEIDIKVEMDIETGKEMVKIVKIEKRKAKEIVKKVAKKSQRKKVSFWKRKRKKNE